ncbi:hypothetical protein [Corynebacterium liangguodongii]|uniref:Uncharacterized protein n=1 Tax=Corynebacterium liangguodongii TaxID=2079535 RepID=A0A2S0WC79_9CORY|nr:hypothetical protein [Corynebacterium liangguodongii]AWB83360.1 hypothetical protein C3E79_01710 [Corynebacterium liangguodongii]PWC00550.1 hypothetical protein DF219_01240 [Corynebacterium liangguodongii]
MTRTLSLIDRAIVFVLGLVIALAGLVPATLYWDIPRVSAHVRAAASRIDLGQLAGAQAHPAFGAALAVGGVLALIAGAWLLVANLRAHTVTHRGIIPADRAHGETTLGIARIAQAACEHMSLSPAVEQARSTVTMVRPRPTVTFTVTANPEYDLADAIAAVERADRDFTTACGQMGIDTVYKLHLERIS